MEEGGGKLTVVIGVMVIKPARTPLMPSAKTPPWIRDSKRRPSTSSLETSQVAVISPMASQAQMM